MALTDLFSTVLNMSLAATFVILVVYLARWGLQRAPKIYSYLLWALVLFRLLCPVSIASTVSVIPNRIAYGEIVSEWNDDYVGKTHHIYFDNRPEFDAAVEAGRETFPAGEGHSYVVTGSDGVSEPQTVKNTVMPLLAKLWLLGIAFTLLHSAVSYLKLRRRVEAAVMVRKGIFLADHIDTPFVMGIFRPAVYLPSALTEAEQRYIIHHERHHIRRGDHIFKALGFLALTIHWFNPLVWLAFILASRDMEMSCDEAVIRKLGEHIRADYSATLLNLATGHRLFTGTPLAFGEGDPTGRVRNLAKWKKPALWATVCALVLCIVIFVVCGMNPKQENEKLPANGDVLFTDPTATEGETISKLNLKTLDDPLVFCEQAIGKLAAAESYHILFEYVSNGEAGEKEYYRHENDFLLFGTDIMPGNTLFFDGAYYEGLKNREEDYWVREAEEDDFGPNSWLLLWSPAEKKITNLQVSENSISFNAVWPATAPGYDDCDGSFTYEFDENGTLLSVQKDYIMRNGGEVAVTVKSRISPMAHDPQAVYDAIEAAARSATDYGIYIIPEGVSRTGATAIFSYPKALLRYKHTELTYGDFMSLERLENGRWVEVEELPGYEYYVSDSSYPVTDGYGMVHEWEQRFGELPDGHYRLGKLVTVKYNDGKTREQIIYGEFSLPDSVQTGLIPLEELPEKYGAEQAMLDGCFVQADGVARENKELFHQFAVVTQKRVPSSIRIVNWYYGDEPHYDAYDLDYDGSVYTITWLADGQRNSRQFRYLKHFTGEKERDNMAYDSYEHYILLNDDTVTWLDIWKNLISSAAPTPIDFMMVYSDYTYLPKKPQIPANLAKAVLEFEGQALVTITDFDRLEKLHILFTDAEFLGYEPKTHSIGVGLNLLLTTQNGKTITIELDPDNDICCMDGEFIFYGAADEPSYIEKLWYYLDIPSWPDAVYERCENAFRLQGAD